MRLEQWSPNYNPLIAINQPLQGECSMCSMNFTSGRESVLGRKSDIGGGGAVNFTRRKICTGGSIMG